MERKGGRLKLIFRGKGGEEKIKSRSCGITRSQSRTDPATENTLPKKYGIQIGYVPESQPKSRTRD